MMTTHSGNCMWHTTEALKHHVQLYHPYVHSDDTQNDQNITNVGTFLINIWFSFGCVSYKTPIDAK